MKHLILGLLLALWAATASAQTPTPAVPLRSTFSVGKQDTMRALGNMFERRRRAGKIWLGVAAGGGVAALRVAAGSTTPNSSPYAPPPPDHSAAAAIVGGVFCGIPLVMGFVKLAGANQATQDKVVHDYALGGKVPSAVAHRLRHRDFD